MQMLVAASRTQHAIIEDSALSSSRYNHCTMKSLAHIPPATEKRIAVRVKPAAERALRRGHPWIFDQSIRRQSHEGRTGDVAVVFDDRDRFLAIGLYDPDSPIRIRVLHQGQPVMIDDDWYRAQLKTAFDLRNDLPDSGTTGYRLLHGENDGLPGLVIDRYGDSCAVRLDTAAWLPHLAQVLPQVLELVPFRRMILRLSRRVQSQPARLYGLKDGHLLFGPPPERPASFLENGLRFEADLVQGQKTGFFLDQRDNRSLLEAHISRDESLHRLLNVFSYTGAFAVYAARAGADELTNVDSSDIALAGAERNLQLNKDQWASETTSHKTISGDAFEVLDALVADGREFDVVVIDPPSFASSNNEVGRAQGAYRRLTQLGLALLRPQGLLVVASCSSRIDAATFFDVVNRSAKRAGRPLQEVARTSYAHDHPIGFPEGAYLKCLFARAR